jgi:hypothetical protein
MFTRQVPVSAILVDAQSMAGGDMPLKHLAAPPTFEANHVVPVNGSPDRHRGGPLDLCFGRRFTEADERPMNGRNQGRELIGRDLVLPNIGGDGLVRITAWPGSEVRVG